MSSLLAKSVLLKDTCGHCLYNWTQSYVRLSQLTTFWQLMKCTFGIAANPECPSCGPISPSPNSLLFDNCFWKLSLYFWVLKILVYHEYDGWIGWIRFFDQCNFQAMFFRQWDSQSGISELAWMCTTHTVVSILDATKLSWNGHIRADCVISYQSLFSVPFLCFH